MNYGRCQCRCECLQRAEVKIRRGRGKRFIRWSRWIRLCVPCIDHWRDDILAGQEWGP